MESLYARIETVPLLTHSNYSDMIWVPSGKFIMGAPPGEFAQDADESPVTAVALTRGIWMGRYEVTQREYFNIVRTNPSFFKLSEQHPVDKVSWHDATNYCGLLTSQERTSGNISENWEFRLPTEAEWEYACRAGTYTAFSFGDRAITNQANFDWEWQYDANAGFIWDSVVRTPWLTLRVGLFPPNAFGLHDMHGNLWEWVNDWHSLYSGGNVTDPKGPDKGLYKLMRGGAWNILSWHCRSANRSIGVNQYDRKEIVGFRVVLDRSSRPQSGSESKLTGPPGIGAL